MQYVVGKDEETNKIELIGRLDAGGLAEVWRDNKWVSASTLYGILQDGLLIYVTETEAMKLIEERKSRQLQVA